MSNVTIKDIMVRFNVRRDKIKQFNSCQLFIVDSGYGRVLVSYKTIIGLNQSNRWYITSDKYSSTTTRQTNAFIRSTSLEVERVREDTLRDMVNFNYRGY